MKNLCFLILLFALSFCNITTDKLFSKTYSTQNNNGTNLKFDKEVIDFGKIKEGGGPVSGTFKFKNTGTKPIVIYNITSSCGCTTPEWRKEPILPGKEGTIKVTYLNDQGPYPFDKKLTVYSSATKKPTILRITGIVMAKGEKLSDIYNNKIGPLGVKDKIYNDGQLLYGKKNKGEFIIANTSKSKVNIKVGKCTPGLSIAISPSTIMPDAISKVSYTIDSKIANKWGNTDFSAEIYCNGKKIENDLIIHSLIMDDYTLLSKEQLNAAPIILCDKNSETIVNQKPNQKSIVKFNMQNIGHSDLLIRKGECDKNNVKISFPNKIKGGEKFVVTAEINNNGLDKGEHSYTLTLITNSPQRPLVILFISCTIR